MGHFYSLESSKIDLHFVGVPRITLQLLGVKIIPCGVASLFDIQLKQKDWGQSVEILTFEILTTR